jgi:hypothetical protein
MQLSQQMIEKAEKWSRRKYEEIYSSIFSDFNQSIRIEKDGISDAEKKECEKMVLEVKLRMKCLIDAIRMNFRSFDKSLKAEVKDNIVPEFEREIVINVKPSNLVREEELVLFPPESEAEPELTWEEFYKEKDSWDVIPMTLNQATNLLLNYAPPQLFNEALPLVQKALRNKLETLGRTLQTTRESKKELIDQGKLEGWSEAKNEYERLFFEYLKLKRAKQVVLDHIKQKKELKDSKIRSIESCKLIKKKKKFEAPDLSLE